MKQYRSKKLLGWLAATALLLTTSCTDELFGTSSGKAGDVTVTFTLAPEAATTLATRSGDDDDGPHVTYPDNTTGRYAHIGDGSKADVLVYAVYDGDTEELLTGYSSGTDEELEKLGFSEGDGQTIKKVTSFPYTFSLSLKRNKRYKIAFWAQSSKTKAYEFSDLRKVEVKYGEIGQEMKSVVESPKDGLVAQTIKTTTPNNDEFRDAFCRSIEIETTGNGTQHKVLLYRPLAQINIGTSGYDFESITRNAEKKYLFSKIRINRVARYLNVVEDVVYSTTTGDDPYTETPEAFVVADFGFAPIPAYANYRDTVNLSRYIYPQYPSYTVWDWKHDADFSSSFIHSKEVSEEIYKPEEFLKVNLYADRKPAQDNEDTRTEAEEGSSKYFTSDGYTTNSDDKSYLDYANLTLNDAYKKENPGKADLNSETFKYLSMCYVLTSSHKDKSILINNIKMWVATDAEGGDSIEIANITQVPARRNWRTNIIGNLLTEENTFEVKLDKDFAGEYDGWSQDGKWEWSGPLAKGVYYDAENDEIQISDADGLRWFQRMVNGNLTVRAANQGVTPSVGSYYNYYYFDNNDKEQKDAFEYDGYTPNDYDGENGTIVKRILKATHQEDRADNKSWPENNNFHFTGVTVKLMADINLAGDEWIPIGFDYKVAEFINNYPDKDTFKDSYVSNRGFYGTFDGNGHTISNLTTKRFSAMVDDGYIENVNNQTTRNYDALPWFGRGLFGAIGGNATIKNVRLNNVDILGCHGVGGIVGIAYGDEITIDNCIVDGGTLTSTPMYRNDSKNETEGRNRSFARGTYLGGIAGYFNTRKGKLTNCTVKNLFLKGYRQVGGLIGTIDRKYDDKDKDGNTSQGKDNKSEPASISNNSVSNTTIIASQLHFPFGLSPRIKSSDRRLLFGWSMNTDGTINSSYDLYAGELIGGDYAGFLERTLGGYCSNNAISGLTFSKMTEKLEKVEKERKYIEDTEQKDTIRISEIYDVPLQYMPALSSWFTDSILLHGNYYGLPSAHKIHKVHDFLPIASSTTPPTEKGYAFPMLLPLEVEMAWDTNSANVGVYVETVSLNGWANPLGHRSVFTPTSVSKPGACCMYVTARDRANAGKLYKDRYDGKSNNYAQPTIIRNIVLRGDPYAYTGLLLAPNENMSKVVLDSVFIYDVYQTIALDDEVGTGSRWPTDITPENTEVLIKRSNLRGYTVLGKGWKKIDYDDVTFEQGSFTGNGDRERMCKVENVSGEGCKTTFKNCYFKAPYIIDLSEADLSKVEFKDCKAAATSMKTPPIVISEYSKIETIEIKNTVNGDPEIIITGTLK